MVSMIRSAIIFFCSAFLAFICVSCVSTAAFQTAQTLQPGEYEIVAGTSVVSGKKLTSEVNENTTRDGGTYSISEIGGRVGIVEKLDLGIKFLGNGLGIDGKYQLSGPKAHLATALSLGAAQALTGDEPRQTDVSVRDMFASFLVSVHLLENTIAAYAIPRLYMRTLGGEMGGSMMLYYLAFGTKVGKSFGGYLETSVLKSMRSDFEQQQYSLGFFIQPSSTK